MIAVTFLPLVVAEIDNQHIEVEVLANRLPQTVQAVLRLAAWMLASVLFLVLAWVSSVQAWDAHETGTFIVEQDTKIQIWISYFMLPIGAGNSATTEAQIGMAAIAGLFVAIATIFASAGFSALSGSSVACAAAMGPSTHTLNRFAKATGHRVVIEFEPVVK